MLLCPAQHRASADLKQHYSITLHAPCDISGTGEKSPQTKLHELHFNLYSGGLSCSHAQSNGDAWFCMVFFIQATQWIMNACGERGSGLWVFWGFFFAGGSLLATLPLWNSSTDVHIYCETATKLDGEIDADRNGNMFSSEEFPLYVSPLPHRPLCLSLTFSPSVLSSDCGLMNFSAVPWFYPLSLPLAYMFITAAHNSISIISFCLSMTYFLVMFQWCGCSDSFLFFKMAVYTLP